MTLWSQHPYLTFVYHVLKEKEVHQERQEDEVRFTIHSECVIL